MTPPKSLKVMIVDTDPHRIEVILSFLQQKLKLFELEFFIFDNVEDAWFEFKTNWIDIVIVELILPRQCGGILAELIRRREKDAKLGNGDLTFMVCHTLMDPHLAEMSSSIFGFDMFISKPLDKEQDGLRLIDAIQDRFC